MVVEKSGEVWALDVLPQSGNSEKVGLARHSQRYVCRSK
jgi:hypothetical protein